MTRIGVLAAMLCAVATLASAANVSETELSEIRDLAVTAGIDPGVIPAGTTLSQEQANAVLALLNEGDIDKTQLEGEIMKVLKAE